MKRLWSILLWCWVSVSAFASLHQYAPVSQLATGKTVKIQVSQSGLYKLTYEQIKSMGLNPQQVRILGYGGAMLEQNFLLPKIDDLPSVAFYMEKGADGVFSAGDYILFYAQGPVSWRYTGTTYRHTTNPYSKFGYYFVSDSQGKQVLLNESQPFVPPVSYYRVTEFTDHLVQEQDLVNLVDLTGHSGGGREFYGPEMTKTSNTQLNYTFRFPNLVEGSVMRAFVDMAANSDQNAVVQVVLGTTTKNLTIPSMQGQTVSVQAMAAMLDGVFYSAPGERQAMSLTYTTPLPTSKVWFNYAEVVARRKLVLTDHYMVVRNNDFFGSMQESLFFVEGTTAQTQVWNITHLDSIYRMPCQWEAGTLQIAVRNDEIQELVILNPQQAEALSPVVVGEVKNQNLHSLKDIDWVVICPEAFRSSAQRLAAAHAAKGLTTAVVSDQEVYNEFSSGTPDATAYRWLMKMLYDRALDSQGKQHKPQFLLLMGDGSFDNRKLLLTSAPNTLLTYQATNSVAELEAYATDDYFTWLDDNEGTRDVDPTVTMDISVGRFPVNTAQEAEEMTDKTIRYIQSASTGVWKTQTCFMADDGDAGTHTIGVERAAEEVRLHNPDLVVNKVYLDAYQQVTTAASESYPLAKLRMDNLLQNGVLLFNYSGHGGYNNITGEGILDANAISQMSNSNLGVWFFATCSFSHFDSFFTSAGEKSVLNPHGGAIGILSACRTVYATQNSYLDQFFCRYLFDRDSVGVYHNTIGDAIRLAKNYGRTFRQTQDKNMLPYIYLGDPAVQLPFADDYTVSITALPDTLKALSKPVLKGFVRTHEGDTATWFNGKVNITVWDKIQIMQTLDNDQTDESKKVKVKYWDYPNILFKGDAQVKEGLFEFSFMVPKDIRYNYGKGRMLFYAVDEQTHEEAMGHYEDFVVGGSSDILVSDSVGPQLSLYLNNPAFPNGGKTNQFPHFYAQIADENGINTVGSGIGHDLTLILDDDPQQTYLLNDYFAAATDSYTQGLVSYRLGFQTEGRHSLVFKAWDLLNNSASARLDYEVVTDYAPQIFSVMTYPNPVSQNGTVHLIIEHDKPDAVLQTLVTLYNMQGQVVRTYSQTGAQEIVWNMAEQALPVGLYFYRVQLKTDTSKYVSKTGKLIITH